MRTPFDVRVTRSTNRSKTFGFGGSLRLDVRIEMLERERHVDVALPDRREQMRRVREAQRARGRVELVVVGLRELAALDLAIENLLPELLGRRLRFALEHLANLVTRAARADVREPIARRLGGRRRDDLDRLRIAQRP